MNNNYIIDYSGIFHTAESKQIQIPADSCSDCSPIAYSMEKRLSRHSTAMKVRSRSLSLTPNFHPENLSVDSDKEEEEITVTPRSFIRKYRGFFYTLLSSLIFSFTALIVKNLHDYNPIVVSLWRFQGALIPGIPLTLYAYCSKRCKEGDTEQTYSVTEAGDKIEKEKDKILQKWQHLKVGGFLLLRSILTCNALLLHFYSLQKLPLGDALVISSSTPVFCYFFAHYFLKEPCGVIPILTSLLTFVGVVVVVKPPHLFGGSETGFDYDTVVGSAMALGCTVLSTLSMVTLRYLRKAHYSIITLFFGGWGTIEMVTLSFILGVFSLPHGTQDWLLAGVMASLTLVGQFAIIRALQTEATGPVSLVRTFDVIFGFLWQIIFSRMLPDLYSIIGASIVVIGVVITGLRKWLASLPEDNGVRRKMWFLLL